MKRFIVPTLILILTFNAFSSIPDYYCDTVRYALRPGLSICDGEIFFEFIEDTIVYAMHYFFWGGYSSRDSTIQTFCKYSPDGDYDHIGSYGNNIYQFGEYIGNADTVWDNALKVPDSMVRSGFYRSSPDTIERETIICFRSDGDEFTNPWPSYREKMYLGQIYYIKKGNRYLKMQILSCDYSSGTYGPHNSTYTNVTDVTVQYATDSAGNGVFDIPTGTKDYHPSHFSPDKPVSFLLSNNHDKIIIKAPNDFMEENPEAFIYSIRGRLIKRFNNTRVLDIRSLAKGSYLLRITYPGQKESCAVFYLNK